MKWMITSILLGALNLVYMTLAAASKFGPIPAKVPLILSVLSFCFLILSMILAFLNYEKGKYHWVQNLIPVFLWAGLIVYNFWNFQMIMYVV